MKAANHRPPAFVVVHHAAQRVEEQGALEILVLRRLGVHAAVADDRPPVLHLRLVAIHVLDRVGLALHVLDVQAFEIGRPAFVDPHVGAVGGADAVAEPLVAAFVNDDEVEPRADADARPVAAEVAVLEAVAVGHRALMLHAGIGHLDQLVAVVLERIFAEVVLKGFEHPLGLGELLLGLLQVFRQRVEIEVRSPSLSVKCSYLPMLSDTQ